MLLGRHVIRPAIAGLMGAYGAALYAKTARKEASSLLDSAEIEGFTYRSTAAVCGGCGNHCHLTINFFREEEKYVSGAKCDRGAGLTGKKREELRISIVSKPNGWHRFSKHRHRKTQEGRSVFRRRSA